MIRYNYFGKEQKIYYDELENGLQVYILPNKYLKSFHITLLTKYGSDIERFIPDGEKDYVNIPLGLAHFLEHKMFDMEDGDIFDYFAKNELYSNAGTNNFVTKYYIEGKKNFRKGLNSLLKMVYTPYFTQKTIDKEIGIISEEIKMYDDEPEWQLEHVFRKCFYKHYGVTKVEGTEESIKTITKEMLDKVYDIFYQPCNMALIVSGHVLPNDVMKILKENNEIKNFTKKKKIIYEDIKETKEVIKEYQQIEGNVIFPKLKYGFKFDFNDFSLKDKNLLENYLDLVFAHLFDEASYFHEEVKEKNLATWYYANYSITKDDIYTFSVEAESEYADLFIEKVDETVKKIQIDKEDFARIIKYWYSIIIRSIDSSRYIANIVAEEIIKKKDKMDAKENIDKLKYDELMEVIKQMDFSNKSFVLQVPKSDKS